jgi:hypothetical protein
MSYDGNFREVAQCVTLKQCYGDTCPLAAVAEMMHHLGLVESFSVGLGSVKMKCLDAVPSFRRAKVNLA